MNKKELVLRILKLCFGAFALAGAVIGAYDALGTFLNAFNFNDGQTIAALILYAVFTFALWGAVGFVGVKVILDLSKNNEPEEKWLPLLLIAMGGTTFLANFLYLAIIGAWTNGNLWVPAIYGLSLLAFGLLSLLMKQHNDLFGFFGYFAVFVFCIFQIGVNRNIPAYEGVVQYLFLTLALLMVVALFANKLIFAPKEEVQVAPKGKKAPKEEAHKEEQPKEE